MLPDRENIQAQTRQLVFAGFTMPLKHWWDDHRTLVENYLELMKKYEYGFRVGTAGVDAEISYRQELISILDHQVRPETLLDFSVEFNEYLSSAESYVMLFPEKVKAVQPDSAMVQIPGDRFLLRTGKGMKRAWYVLSRLPLRIRNRMLRLFNRQPLPVPPLGRRVPLRQIIQNLVLCLLPEELFQSLVKPLYDRIELDIRIMREIDKVMGKSFTGTISAQHLSQEFKTVRALVADLRRGKDYSYAEGIHTAFEKVWSEFTIHFEKGGTLELASRYFSKSRIKKRRKQLANLFRKAGIHKNLSISGSLDEWQSSVSILLLASQVEKKSLETSQHITEYIQNTIGPAIAEVRTFLEEAAEKLRLASDHESVFSMLSDLGGMRIPVWLNEKIPVAAEKLLNEDVVIRIQDFIAHALEYASQVAESYQVISGDNSGGRLLTTGDLTRIRLRQLIEHDALPVLLDPISKLKDSLVRIRRTAYDQLMETGHIAEYNLETAVSLIGTDSPPDEIREIAGEGIGRAVVRITETQNLLQKLTDQTDLVFQEKFELFQSKLHTYLLLESLLDARSRVIKARAIRKSEHIWAQFISGSRSAGILLINHLIKVYVVLKNQYNHVRSKLGLELPAPLVSPEISDFLAETETAIARLPYVYQRLFVLSPLTDEKFFRGRKAELYLLEEAFQNWQEGRYAPTVIVGETGSGSTSLLNLFSHNHLTGIETHRLEVLLPVSAKGGLISLLCSLFPDAALNGKDELVSYLNGLSGKQVLILEGIQHLFVREIYGFDAIRLFAEIVSATNRNIFWLVTSTLYGWQYLDKVIQLSDFFGYIIELRSLSDEEIVDVILRRHMASGYNLRFELPEGEKPGRAYKRLKKAEEQQSYLKEKYFTALNQFARSNIAISMLLWLRSAKEVKGNDITIALPKGLNVSFINSLSREKLFVLQALLLHDGLPADAIASVLNFSEAKARMRVVQLYDDGIIVVKRGLYMVNPLLYRQVVVTLKYANLIH